VFGSVVLDVAIGMVLVYLLLSLVATAGQELLARWSHARAALLEEGMCELLVEPELVAAVYSHPMIASLYRGTYAEAKKKKQLPSYIPAKNFSAALLDIAVRGRDMTSSVDAGPRAAPLSADSLRKTVARLDNRPAQRLLLTMLDLSNNDLGKLQANVEAWFDSSMDRVSGWYKRKTQGQLLVIGIGLAIFANVDSIHIASQFYVDPGVRQAAVALASQVVKDSNFVKTGSDTAIAKLQSLKLPIGRDFPPDWKLSTETAFPTLLALPSPTTVLVVQRLVGWILTALAISLGAPFWFDMLNRIMVIRSTVKPREKSGPEKSKDPHEPVATPPTVIQAGRAAGVTVVTPTVSPNGTAFEANEWSSGHSQGGLL
jgi:hypothetical protein